MIGIVTVGEQAMADRFAYIPFIGLFIALVWTLNAWITESSTSKYRIPTSPRRHWPRPAHGHCRVVFILGCLTYRQLGYWHDDETLWRYTLSVTERNYMAHDNLALALAKQGRSDEAVVEFQAAEALHKYPPAQILELAPYEITGWASAGSDRGMRFRFAHVRRSSRFRPPPGASLGRRTCSCANMTKRRESYPECV